jgi:hypothetical protein
MLWIIGELQFKKVACLVTSSIAYSLQIDGSVSRTMRDNKFVSARVLDKDSNLSTVFFSVRSPESKGAQGLLEAVVKTLSEVGVETQHLAGVTTDGEAANTGSKGGLWRLLSNHLDRDIFTFWYNNNQINNLKNTTFLIRSRCIAHRSDLALEDLENTVAEMAIWKVNLQAVATYFRTSKNNKLALLAVSYFSCNRHT